MLVDDVSGSSVCFSSSTCMGTGIDCESAPLLDASTFMDSGLLVAIEAGSAVIVDDTGRVVALGGAGGIVALVSCLVPRSTESWLVV